MSRPTARVIRTRAKRVKAETLLQPLLKDVARNKDVHQSALVLVRGIAQLQRESATDPVTLLLLASGLVLQAEALAAAVTKGTPAA